MKGPCATRTEKLAAFHALTPDDKGRLLRYARYIAKKFCGRVNEADAEDLYQHGMMRALYSRQWYPQMVDFVGFVAGSIRSTGDQWAMQSSIGKRGATQPRYTAFTEEVVDLGRHEQQIEAAMTIEKMRETIKGRPYAVEIFDLRAEGRSAKEIQKQLGTPAKVYEAAVKWIHRTLERKGFL